MDQIIERLSRTNPGGRSAIFIAAGLGALIGISTAVYAGSTRTQTATLTQGGKTVDEGAALSAILSPSDVSTYRAIFSAQEAGNWAGADKDFRHLRDGRLIGHVLAQRYLDQRYTPKYDELVRWLRHFGDLPEAAAIYKAAMERRPKGTKPPRPSSPAGTVDAMAAKSSGPKPSTASPSKPETVSEGLLPAELADQDPVPDDATAAYFFSGRYKDALALAESAVKGSGDRADSAHWTAGLAAWRLGLMERATEHFAELAASTSASGWSRAAGAYWAARANLALGNSESFTAWLGVAAKYSRTFYGLLAQGALGLPTGFDRTTPVLAESEIAAIAAQPAGGRAFALLQVGQRALAERDLRQIRADGPATARTLMAVALKADLPALAMTAGHVVARVDEQRFDSALYPVPAWRPAGGYHIDKALLFALMRQESGFQTTASSSAGALGLMQLMPSTASFMAQNAELKGNSKLRLFEPELNIALGQKYVAHLLDHEAVQGNLLNMLAAYNGGPGNLAKWQRVTDHGDDPLLFIESIPVRETRVFVQKVLANYWIYSARFGRATPSLEAIAAGEWPSYTSPGAKTAAKNARH